MGSSAWIDGRQPPRRGPNGKDKDKKKKPIDPKVKKKADELHSMGMPFQMAMAVAHGRLDLNEALERMAQKDRVNKLMRDHDLSRALATQVAMGHADLEQVLARRRLQQHRDAYRDRTCLTEGRELTFGFTSGETRTGSVGAVEAYSFTFTERKGEPAELHKLRLKYAYEPDAWKVVKKVLKAEKRSEANANEPAVRPQDRYSCSDKRLFGYMDGRREVMVTTLEGDSLRGHVSWFSRYEFAVKVKGDVEVIIFRHALKDLTAAT